MFVRVETLRKPDEYREARRLRRKGVPMKQIAARLRVSPGTIHRWTSDIRLTPAQRARNLGRNRPGQPGWILTRGRIRKARAVRPNNGRSIGEIERYWLDALDLPRSCLRKHTLNHLPTSSSGKKKALPYGVCTVGAKRGTAIAQQIYGAIQEYTGSDEPRWLD